MARTSRKYRESLPLLALALALLSGACSTPGRGPASTTAAIATRPADQRFEEYLATVDRESIQPDCLPQHLLPAQGTPRLGTVLLIHGFTACPQQYFEWSEQLTRRGYEVFLFLLPGHGRFQLTAEHDDISRLPTDRDWGRYDELANQVNRIAEVAEGQRVIGGLSVGAAVAMDAVLKAPRLYDRQIIFSPYIESSEFAVRAILQAEEQTELPLEKLRHAGLSWGAGCVHERALGRAGICEFMPTNISAISLFGKEVLARVRPVSARTQVVTVEGDPVAWIEDDKRAIGLYRGPGAEVAACMVPQGANHSLLSRYDAPEENKWWLRRLLAAATAFVVDGTPVPQAGPSIEKAYRRCDVRYY